MTSTDGLSRRLKLRNEYDVFESSRNPGQHTLRQGGIVLRVRFDLCPASSLEPIPIPIPTDFRRHFISFIKTLLLKSPYYERFNKDKPGYSPYAFGVKFGRVLETLSENGTMMVRAPVSVIFSTGLYDLMTDVCNAAITMKGKDAVLGLQLNNITLMPNREFRSDTVEFKTVGHLVLRGQNGYLAPSDKATLEEAINTHLRIRQAFLRENYPGLNEIPLDPVILRDYSQFHKGVCEHYGGKITTLRGSFTLSGDPRCLQFIYDYGLGVRSGQGFGLLEVVKEL